MVVCPCVFNTSRVQASAVLGSPLGCPFGTFVAFDVAVALNPVEVDDGEVSLYLAVESTKSADTCGHVPQRPTPLESPHNYEGVCENEKWWSACGGGWLANTSTSWGVLRLARPLGRCDVM